MGVRDTIAKAVMGIKAYHSSPHDFDKFDLKKIGTGEGAQVYGHGLYFAENPKVSGQGGQYWDQFSKKFEGPEYLAAGKLKKAGFDRDAAIALAQKDHDAVAEAFKYGTHPPGLVGQHDPYTLESITKNMLYDRQQQLELLRSGKPVGPRTYEVNIKADPAQMLDWDRPLREQSPLHEGLQDIFKRKEILQHPSGQSLYDTLLSEYSPSTTSAMLGDVGIPGIKYLDEGSRGSLNLPALEKQFADQQEMVSFLANTSPSGPRMQIQQDKLSALEARLADARRPPTSNYVVFDPDQTKIEIMKKYGVVGAPAGALGATYDQSQYEVQP